MSGSAPALIAAAAGVAIGHAVLPDHWVPMAVIGRVNRYRPGRVARLALAAGVAHVIFSLLLGAVIVIVGLQFRHAIEGAQDTIIGSILLATGVVFAGLELAGRGHHHGPGGHSHGHDHGHSHGHADSAGHGHTHTHGHTHSNDGAADHDHTHRHDGAADHDHTNDHTHDHDHAEPDHGLAAGVAGSRRQRLFTVIVPLGAAASPDLTILPVFLAAAASGAAVAVGTLVVFALATVATIVGLTVLAFLTGYRLEGQWLERWGNTITAGVLLVIGGLVVGHVI